MGVTVNDGVFSPWNGQSPLYVVPAFLSWTVSPTMSTMLSLLLTSAVMPPAVFLDLRSAVVPYVREHASVPSQPAYLSDVRARPTCDVPDMTEGLSSLDRPSELHSTPEYPS